MRTHSPRRAIARSQRRSGCTAHCRPAWRQRWVRVWQQRVWGGSFKHAPKAKAGGQERPEARAAERTCQHQPAPPMGRRAAAKPARRRSVRLRQPAPSSSCLQTSQRPEARLTPSTTRCTTRRETWRHSAQLSRRRHTAPSDRKKNIVDSNLLHTETAGKKRCFNAVVGLTGECTLGIMRGVAGQVKRSRGADCCWGAHVDGGQMPSWHAVPSCCWLQPPNTLPLKSKHEQA